MISRRSIGFTLIEVVAVIAIMGLLVVAVSIHVPNWFSSAGLNSVIDQLVYLDRLARERAKRSGEPVVLVFDLESGEWRREQQKGSTVRAHRFQLPRGYSVEQVQTVYEHVESGEAMISCSVRGHTPTYALLLTGPSDRRRWMVVMGITGQAVELDHDQEVNDLFISLAS